MPFTFLVRFYSLSTFKLSRECRPTASPLLAIPFKTDCISMCALHSSTKAPSSTSSIPFHFHEIILTPKSPTSTLFARCWQTWASQRDSSHARTPILTAYLPDKVPRLLVVVGRSRYDPVLLCTYRTPPADIAIVVHLLDFAWPWPQNRTCSIRWYKPSGGVGFQIRWVHFKLGLNHLKLGPN